MKITKKRFTEALDASWQKLKAECPDTANYKANLLHNAGRYNYWQINRVEVDGVTYYCSSCCKTANSDIAVVKRVCARS